MKVTCELHQIGNAIRKANGTKEKILASEFDKEISKLCHIDDNINGHIESIEPYEITPTNTDLKVPGRKYLKGDVTIKGDENLKSENILRGDYNQNLISVFGVPGTLDVVRKFNTYVGGSEYYGDHVADVARSYHLARVNGEATFKYNQTKGILNDGTLTDSEGRCYLDCSMFIGLVLRGIEFNDTPYAQVKGQPNKHLNHLGLYQSIVKDLCDNSIHKWANKYFDRQTHPHLKDIGVPGYRSIRNAAQMGEYYYSQGATLYEFNPKELITEVPKGLKAGDLIFWSKEIGSDRQKSRFKAITHVAVVARDTTRYYQVTGSDDKVGDTVFYSYIADHLEEISLIVRPNYNPIDTSIQIGQNLLPRFSYDSCDIIASHMNNGVQYTPLVAGGFNIERKSTSTNGSTFYMYKGGNPLKLTKGRYQLSGCPINENASDLQTTRDWGIMIKDVKGTIINDVDGVEVLDKGKGCTFELTSTKEVSVYFYMSKSLDGSFTCLPSLIKLS